MIHRLLWKDSFIALSTMSKWIFWFSDTTTNIWASLVAQTVKTLPAMQETRIRSLGWEYPLEKGMATHSSILAWGIPSTEEPGGLQSMESQSWTQLSTAQHSKSWSPVIEIMAMILITGTAEICCPFMLSLNGDWSRINVKAGTTLNILVGRVYYCCPLHPHHCWTLLTGSLKYNLEDFGQPCTFQI